MSDDSYMQSPRVRVKYLNDRGMGGRGVVANMDIKAGDLIEAVPCLLMPDRDCPWGTVIANYVFEWIDDVNGEKTSVLALGYGSLYNHSYNPNAYYEMSLPDCLSIYARRDIPTGEEITINYNADPEDQSEVHFEVNDPGKKVEELKVNNALPKRLGRPNRNKFQKAGRKGKNKAKKLRGFTKKSH